MTQSSIFCLGIVFCLAISTADAYDWPQWLGPERNGISPEKGWLTDWPKEGLPVLWRASVGTGFSPISIKDGRAYTMGFQEGMDTVYCFNAETGETLWKYSYPSKIHDYNHEGGPATAPLLDATAVYTFSREADLICLNALNGQVIWSRNLVKEYEAKIPLIGFSASPLLFKDRVVVDAGIAFAFNKKDGRLIWRTEKYIESYSSPQLFDLDTLPHLAFFNGTGLVVLEAFTGKEVWCLPWRTPKFDTNTSTPIISEGKVFFSSGYDRGCALARIGEPSESAVIWQDKRVRSSYNTCILTQGHLFGFNEVDLTCWDFETGEVKWTEDFNDDGCQILADGKLIIQTAKGDLVLVEANTSVYKEISRVKVLEGRCWTLPVLCNRKIYCRNSKGDVVCLDVRGPRPWDDVDQGFR